MRAHSGEAEGCGTSGADGGCARASVDDTRERLDAASLSGDMNARQPARADAADMNADSAHLADAPSLGTMKHEEVDCPEPRNNATSPTCNSNEEYVPWYLW